MLSNTHSTPSASENQRSENLCYGIVDCRSFKNTSEEIIPKTLNLHILITDKPQIDEHIETDKKLYNTPLRVYNSCKENKPNVMDIFQYS